MPHMRLNILYVGRLPPHPGGSAISCSQLLIGFAALGHMVRALAPITVEALRPVDSWTACPPEIRVMRFLVPYFQISTYLPPPDEYRQWEGEQIRKILPSLITDERPDIVITGQEAFAWHVPTVAKAHSLPCILMVRGGATQGILDGTYPKALARQLLAEYRKANLTITPAKYLAEGLRQSGLANIKVIPNAVDLRQFSPTPKDPALLQELAIRDDEIVVVHVSNLKPLKRPLDILHLAEKVVPQHPRLVFVIVGDGPCRGRLEETCRRTQIWKKFRFAGWVDYHQIPAYINLADIVAMPSETEAQARVYLETQACARLLLASDIPAAREVIVDGETGLLFRKADIDDLTAKILLAAGNPEIRAAIGHKARERVQSHSLDAAVAAYLASFEEVVRQHGERLR